MSPFSFQIRELSPAAKRLVLCVVLAFLAGFIVAIAQAYIHTGFDAERVILDYRGSSDPDSLAQPKSLAGMVGITHVHALSVPVVYFILSFLFLGTALSEKTKKIFITLLFCGFFGDYLGLWLLRYVSGSFYYLSLASHAFGDTSYLVMTAAILRECLSCKSKS